MTERIDVWWATERILVCTEVGKEESYGFPAMLKHLLTCNKVRSWIWGRGMPACSSLIITSDMDVDMFVIWYDRFQYITVQSLNRQEVDLFYSLVVQKTQPNPTKSQFQFSKPACPFELIKSNLLTSLLIITYNNARYLSYELYCNLNQESEHHLYPESIMARVLSFRNTNQTRIPAHSD